MSEIIFQNLQWSVSENGDLICPENNYEISRETFDAVDWPAHMQQKEWCNDFYFRQAYEFSINNTKST